MKITAIKSLVCNARMRNWVFVKVETDQPGLVGLGRGDPRVAHAVGRRRGGGSRHSADRRGPSAYRASLADDVQAAFLAQFGHRSRHGHVGHRHCALGHRRERTWACHATACGAARYATTYGSTATWAAGEWRTSTKPRWPMRTGSPILRARPWRKDISAFKSMAVPPTAALEGTGPVLAAEQAVARMREAVGRRVDIMVDCHARPSPAMGMLFAKALEPYRLFFLEEPCWPEEFQSLGHINASVSTPIATGERLTNLTQFRDLFAARGCEIVQADITHCGGLSAARKIAALAEAHRIGLAPHNPQGPVSTAASFELGFAQSDYVICETVSEDVPWRADVVQDSHPMRTQGRTVAPSDTPGLGVEVDEPAIAKYPFQQELLQRVFYADGSVGDW